MSESLAADSTDMLNTLLERNIIFFGFTGDVLAIKNKTWPFDGLSLEDIVSL
tara:strand:+ start:888 stop:1043 length:156 start_codon:yes stop_codon:yes gene_type:complete